MSVITRRQLIAAGAATMALPALNLRAAADTAWPTKPVRVVCSYAAGGQTDGIARTYAEFLSRHFGQPFVVENKTGGSGSVAAVDVKQAEPDGYTLLCSILTTMVQTATLKAPKYDPEKDFAILTNVRGAGLLMVTQSKTNITNLGEFINYAQKAEKVNMGSFGVGAQPHVIAHELNKQYGLKIETIQYRGEAPMWADFMTGSIDVAVGSHMGILPVVESGRGRVIGSVGVRMKSYPQIPTLAEQGATSKLFHIRGLTGFWAPIKTSPAILKKLSDAMVLGGKDQRVIKGLSNYLLEPGGSMDEAKAQFQQEYPLWVSLLKEMGITAE